LFNLADLPFVLAVGKNAIASLDIQRFNFQFLLNFIKELIYQTSAFNLLLYDCHNNLTILV
jgi:hypothetical protein